LRAGSIQSISGESAARTIADGLRSQSIGQINFEHIRRYVDAIVTVSEDEIRQAMRRLLLSARIVAEPSGAVTTAAALFRGREIGASGTTVAVVSGGNVDPKLLSEIVSTH
jgi:threonine dehydratase